MKKKESHKPVKASRDFGLGLLEYFCACEGLRLFLVIRYLSYISADNTQTKCNAKKQQKQQQNPKPLVYLLI